MKENLLHFLLFSLSPLLLVPFSLSAQETQKIFKQDDVFSIFVKKSKRAARDSATAKPAVLYKPYFSITPYVGYNPAYGGLIGVGSTIGMYLGSPETTPISTAVVAANVTAKGQILLNLRTNIVTDHSKYIFRGDLRYLIFSQSTFGLGTGIAHTGRIGLIFNDGGQTAPITADEEPINYNYIRFYETFYFKITKMVYAGIGFCLDDYKKVADQKLNLDTVPQQVTHHYEYSTDHGFDPEKQTMSGVSIGLLIDSRDNSIRPTKGYFADVAFRPNFTFLGSTKNSLMFNTEFRTYVNVSKERPDHLVGFWYIGQFTQKGKVPYLGLPAISWDMYNRTGRGYIQGSIRGVNFLYGEAEYRFPISKYTGILAGVVFANATTASSDDDHRALFEYFDPAVGAGIRIMFNRKTLSNLAIDCGVGKGGEVGIYFNLNETF
jgi:outer membrane protein assembly factor BamA